MKPVLQNITTELLRRLERINIANGYEFNAGAIRNVQEMEDADDYRPQPRDIFVQFMSDDENEERSYPGNPRRTAWDLVYKIHGYAKWRDFPSEDEGIVNTGVTEEQMTAAIRDAITNDDASGWHTFADNAENAWLQGSEKMESAIAKGVTVEVMIEYRTKETDQRAVG